MATFMGTYKREPILSIKYENNLLYMDNCPPFEVGTAAIMIEKTTLAGDLLYK